MEFEAVDRMRYLIASENVITPNTFNSYAISDIERYRKHLRKEFQKFIDELDEIFKSPEILTEHVFLGIVYRSKCWEAYWNYCKSQSNTFSSEFKNTIEEKDILLFNQFFKEKERYAEKINNFLKRGVDSIIEGFKMYKELGKKSELEKAMQLWEKNKNRNLYFTWKRDIRERDILFNYLKSEEFIDKDVPRSDFARVFIAECEIDMNSCIPNAHKIKWIDKSRNPRVFNRRSLIYLIQKMLDFNIIEYKTKKRLEQPSTKKKLNEIRNNIIKYYFADNLGNPIKDTGDVQGDEQPQRFEQILKTLKELQ
jgi:hypothetical protein